MKTMIQMMPLHTVGREVANAMLSHVPSEFTFYSAKEAIEKQKKEDGEEHHFVEPATFHEAYDHPETRFNERSGTRRFEKNSAT